MDYKAWATSVFRIEAEALVGLSELLTEDFSRAVQDMYEATGKIVVLGVGKSGIIGKKIAATLASTGTPSIFIHPTDALHGDLGMIQSGDVILGISYSGETEEILRLIPFLKNRNHTLIAITGNPYSTLAKEARYHLNVFVAKEACPMTLAPTASTTATLVMGDALAVALMNLRNFQPENFAMLHPGGNLGKRLLTTVESVMITNNLPLIQIENDMKTLIHLMTKGKLGLAVVVEDVEKRKIQGIITDGDLRRAMDKYEDRFFSLKISEIMTINPKSIPLHTKMTEAENLMTNHKISALLVAENGILSGVIQMYQFGLR